MVIRPNVERVSEMLCTDCAGLQCVQAWEENWRCDYGVGSAVQQSPSSVATASQWKKVVRGEMLASSSQALHLPFFPAFVRPSHDHDFSAAYHGQGGPRADRRLQRYALLFPSRRQKGGTCSMLRPR